MAASPLSASGRMIEAMGLALGRIDATDAIPLLASLSSPDIPEARRQDLLRRLLATTRLISVNCRAGTMLGISEGRLPLPLTEIWPFAEAEQLAQSLSAAIEPASAFRAQLALRSAVGTIHVRYTSWSEEDADAELVTFGLIDVSDQVTAETALGNLNAQMAHADRLSTLGVMTATIAHEVRQPLSAMMTSAQAALRWLKNPDPDLDQVEDCLNTIVLGATKAEETVARLRTMASNRSESRDTCSVRILIEETADFLRQELASRRATLLLDIPDDLGFVTVDRVQLRQVLMNLMINAAQAMADARCWSRALKVRARQSAELIVVDVEDSGPGIPIAARAHLFEGFYSTKANGMGLGLRICQQIVEDHGGSLEYISKDTAGSIFRFSLPRTG